MPHQHVLHGAYAPILILSLPKCSQTGEPSACDYLYLRQRSSGQRLRANLFRLSCFQRPLSSIPTSSCFQTPAHGFRNCFITRIHNRLDVGPGDCANLVRPNRSEKGPREDQVFRGMFDIEPSKSSLQACPKLTIQIHTNPGVFLASNDERERKRERVRERLFHQILVHVWPTNLINNLDFCGAANNSF